MLTALFQARRSIGWNEGTKDRPWCIESISIGIAKVRADGNNAYFWEV